MIGSKIALLFGTMHESKTCRAFISLSHGRNLNHIFLLFNSWFVLKAYLQSQISNYLPNTVSLCQSTRNKFVRTGVERVSLVVSIRFFKINFKKGVAEAVSGVFWGRNLQVVLRKNTRFFISNTKLKLAKNQVKAKQHSEAEM